MKLDDARKHPTGAVDEVPLVAGLIARIVRIPRDPLRRNRWAGPVDRVSHHDLLNHQTAVDPCFEEMR
jgi:hypothetical protein